MFEFEEIEYLDDSELEISIIAIEEEQNPNATADFDADNFDETAVAKEDEARLNTLMELDASYENDRTLNTIYHCPLCKKAFLGKEAIKKHVRRYYKFDCETCQKKYFKFQYLKRHKMNAHLKSRELECPICKKKFKAVNNLKQHLFLHSDEKTFVCDFCPKKFKQKPGLQQHIRHSHKNEMKYECPYCHGLVDRLNYHIKTQHKEEHMKQIEEYSKSKRKLL